MTAKVKVKLREGLNRWHYDAFFIVRGQVKECDPETLRIGGNRLILVPEKKTFRRSRKKEEERDDTPILENTFKKGEDKDE